MNTFKLPLLSVFVLACLLAVSPSSHAQAGGGEITYVDQGATGLNNGTSWANAYTDLQVALTSPTSTNIFWVAEGTYKPTTGTDRTATFLLNDGMNLYGGFAGNEFDIAQRDLSAHLTILSGAIGRPDVSTDNSYHVVKADYSDNVRLDGFTIMDGSANISMPDNAAGGVSFRSDAGDSLYLTHIIFKNNYAGYGGAIYNGYGDVTLEQVTFEANTAGAQGGGVNNGHGTVTLTSVTFNGNSAQGGGGIYNFATVNIFNSTFYDNHATTGPGMIGQGGGIYNNGTVTVAFSTFSHNGAAEEGAGIFNSGSGLTLDNSILANSTSGEDCYNAGAISTHYNLIEDNASAPHMCGAPLSTSDPHLGPLQNNGGFTQTMALLSSSPALNLADDLECPAFDQRGVTRPQGDGCDIGAYEREPSIDVTIAGAGQWSYPWASNTSTRASYAGVDAGPVKIASSNHGLLIASERINLLDHPAVASYTEFMGLPATKLTDTYLFPWYNNVGLDSQLRCANVGTAATTVRVKIGTAVDQTYPLAVNQSMRVSYPGVDTGPVEVKSSGGVPIIASERINLLNHPAVESYTEFIGLLGNDTAGTRYLFPWYNNVSLDSQIRFANVGTAPTTVRVTIGTAVNQTFSLGVNQSRRETFPGVDAGPVEVTSSGGVPIIASERINLLNHPSVSSYSEFLGLPGTTLTHTKYLFPWYNNLSLDSQLRIANVGTNPTTVRVRIGTLVDESYPLAANAGLRLTYAVDTGPVIIESSGGVPIIASERVNLLNHPTVASYAEFLGLSVGDPLGWPGNQLSDTFWFPWYNNLSLDSQLRFGVP